MFVNPRFKARFAQTHWDLEAAQRLRFQAFRGGGQGLDVDHFDPLCAHVLVEDADGRLVCTFRLLLLDGGRSLGKSYAAQFYDLSALYDIQGRVVEMGRFCIVPDVQHPDILRVAWAAMTRYVDDYDVELLVGCSSFQGIEADFYTDSFALLKDRHLAPKRRLPKIKAPSVFRFASKLRLRKPDLKLARRRMPPLLRTYLTMGGWVSDHAVVDRDLNTLHVFTGLEVRAIPASRKRLLRALV